MKPANLLTLIGEEPKVTPNYIITEDKNRTFDRFDWLMFIVGTIGVATLIVLTLSP